MNRLITLVLILTGIYLNSIAQNMSPSFQTSYFEPERIIKKSDHSYFIDFGKAYFGTIYIHSSSSQEDSVVIHLGEKLSHLNTIDRNPPGNIRYQKIKLTDLPTSPFVIPVKQDFRNTKPIAIQLPDSYGYIMPFRYCEIENLKIPITDIEINQKALHYKFNDNASSFSSSDTILNALWDLCKHTIKATSFAGYYVDGDRERIPYEADAYINQLSHYAVDSIYSLARRTNEYFIDHPTWPTEWILHTSFMFYYDYLYTGDTRSIMKFYEQLKIKSLTSLEREDGLISTQTDKLDKKLMTDLGFKNDKARIKDIVDWPKGERDNYEMLKVNTVVNAFYYQNLIIMSKIAGAIGETKDSIMYIAKAEAVKKSINNKLFDRETGLYVDGLGSKHSSLHANMFPLAFEIVPESHSETIIEFIKLKGMACSVYGAQYLLEGLCKYDETEYALQLITDTAGNRNWFNMIRVGSTMTLEAWDIEYKRNLDWNHAWATAPANIIVRYLWGITPETPGFKTIRIAPKLIGLNHTSIKVPSRNGCIFANYEHQRNKEVYVIILPENTKAKFYIDGSPKTIRINNSRIELTGQFILLKDWVNRIEMKY